MNKTEFLLPGGFPNVLDDFAFEQDAVRKAFKGIMAMLAITVDDSFIMWGCPGSSGLGSVGGFYNGGVIYLHGEIYEVDDAIAPAAAIGQDLVWSVVETYDASGDKTLEDTTTAHAYVVRKAQIISAVYDSTIHMLASGTYSFPNKIYSLIASTDWVAVSGDCSYRKTKDGFVHLQGMLVQLTTENFVLPIGFRPAADQSILAIAFDNDGLGYPYHTNVTISASTGIVTATTMDGRGTNKRVSLNGISFKLD